MGIQEGSLKLKHTNTVQFFTLTKDGRRLLGTLILTPEKVITSEPEPGEDHAMESVLADPVFLPDGTRLTREEDPEKWFNRLPYAYHGSYFWAAFG